MRTKKELYEIILNEYRENPSFHLFICNTMEICFTRDFITKEEFDYIMNDFQNNRPSDSQHTEFMDKTYYRESSCWWSVYKEYNKPFEKNTDIRIAFLEKMVQINS